MTVTVAAGSVRDASDRRLRVYENREDPSADMTAVSAAAAPSVAEELPTRPISPPGSTSSMVKSAPAILAAGSRATARSMVKSAPGI